MIKDLPTGESTLHKEIFNISIYFQTILYQVTRTESVK